MTPARLSSIGLGDLQNRLACMQALSEDYAPMAHALVVVRWADLGRLALETDQRGRVCAFFEGGFFGGASADDVELMVLPLPVGTRLLPASLEARIERAAPARLRIRLD